MPQSRFYGNDVRPFADLTLSVRIKSRRNDGPLFGQTRAVERAAGNFFDPGPFFDGVASVLTGAEIGDGAVPMQDQRMVQTERSVRGVFDFRRRLFRAERVAQKLHASVVQPDQGEISADDLIARGKRRLQIVIPAIAGQHGLLPEQKRVPRTRVERVGILFAQPVQRFRPRRAEFILHASASGNGDVTETIKIKVKQ